MLETLNACGAFIVGLSRQDKKNVYKIIDLRDKVVIDIDDDTIESNELIQLPYHLQDYLEDNIG